MTPLDVRLQRVEEMLVDILNKTELPEVLSAEQCRQYLNVTRLKTLSNYVLDGKIPKAAVIELCNGERKYIKSKLTKASLVAPVSVSVKPNNQQLSLF